MVGFNFVLVVLAVWYDDIYARASHIFIALRRLSIMGHRAHWNGKWMIYFALCLWAKTFINPLPHIVPICEPRWRVCWGSTAMTIGLGLQSVYTRVPNQLSPLHIYVMMLLYVICTVIDYALNVAPFRRSRTPKSIFIQRSAVLWSFWGFSC